MDRGIVDPTSGSKPLPWKIEHAALFQFKEFPRRHSFWIDRGFPLVFPRPIFTEDLALLLGVVG